MNIQLNTNDRKESRTTNSTYSKGGVSCSKDSFMVNQTLVFQIKFCCKNPAHRKSANREQFDLTSYEMNVSNNKLPKAHYHEKFYSLFNNYRFAILMQ